MDMLLSLWLPIIVTAVIVFVASSIIWMAAPIHKHDYKNPGDKEGEILALLRSVALAPGLYMVPWNNHGNKAHKAAEARVKEGPWATITVMPGIPNMGKLLGAWFFHLVVVTIFIAYVGSVTLVAGADYLKVFQVIGGAALLAHAGYALPMAIWHGMPWSQLPGRLFDGVVYALLTAGTFGWLWPEAILPTTIG